MDKNFTKFNSDTLNQIYDFINSTDDLLYIAGFQGCGKSEIVNKVLDKTNTDILLFQHLCFENSVIDDFLLGFYDTLRFYSINKKINLKKSLTENFAQKVSFYFKNLDKKSLIIIDNFEIISKNSEIMDFLALLGKFENVKLILISRVLNPEFFKDKGLNFQIIDILPNDFETFKLKVQDALEIYSEDDIKELFDKTKGYELYLKMALRYIITVNTTLKEFMDEFKKRNLEFDDFLLSKIVSLVPPIYLPFLQNMSCLNHSVKIDFIEHYNLGDISLVNYLYRKMLISKFDNEIYLKDYLKQYFLGNLSIQEKIDNYKNLIEIYKQELSKSPKDRLLRLSRESIRKQIDFLQSKIPNINKPKSLEGIDFSYIAPAANAASQATSGTKTPWYMKLALEGGKKFQKDTANAQNMEAKTSINNIQRPLFGEEILSDEEELLIKEFRRNKAQKNILDEVKKLEENYDYNGAITCLLGLLGKVSDKSMVKEIEVSLAKNYSKIHDIEKALNAYSNAKKICKELGDSKGYIGILLSLAELYKNLYRFNLAKECLNEIVNTDDTAFTGIKNTISKGYLELGEIFETENNFESALKYYQKAIETGDKDNPDNELLSEIYYKTALLYDNGQEPQNALKYYKISIQTGKNNGAKNLSTCFANSGLIYIDFWTENSNINDFQLAVENFEAALEIDKKENNNNGIYFASKQLSGLFRDNDNEKSIKYLNLALDSALKLDDSFKIAISYLEIGDYYYNKQNNKDALISYLKARKALGSSISKENKERISIRINDMKIKMENSEFKEILKEYE